MQKIIATGRLLATLFVLSMLWIGYGLVSLFLQPIDNKHIDCIPEDAHFVLRIETHKILKESLSSLIVYEDDKTIELLSKLYRKDGKTKVTSTGISFQSDFILFKHDINNFEYTGILFNLNDSNVFMENMPSLANNEMSVVTNGTVGLLYYETKGNKTSSKAQLNRRANEILNQKTNFDIDQLGKPKKTTITQLWSNRGLFEKTNSQKKTILALDLSDKTISVRGEIPVILQEKQYDSMVLKPKGLHLRSSSVNKTLNDTLSSFFKSLHLRIPKIREGSVNYYGLEIIDEPSYFIAPRFDALITFDDTLDFNSTIRTFCQSNDIKQPRDHTISFKGLQLHYRQLNSNTLVIGVNQNPELIDQVPRLSALISGPTEDILSVSGPALLKRALLMIPTFRASSKFVNEADFVDLRIKTPQNGTSKIYGSIEFKQEEHALNSILRLLIQAI